MLDLIPQLHEAWQQQNDELLDILNLLCLSRMTANSDFEEKTVEIVYAFANYV